MVCLSQVKVNFGGRDAKWDEWVHSESDRIRPIQVCVFVCVCARVLDYMYWKYTYVRTCRHAYN